MLPMKCHNRGVSQVRLRLSDLKDVQTAIDQRVAEQRQTPIQRQMAL